MPRSLTLPPLLACAALWLGLPGAARAVYPPPIKDEGKFFGKEALEKANKKIRELYQKYKKDVVIETMEAPAADQEKKLKDEGEKKFFMQWAESRGKEVGLNGLLIVISKKPRNLQTYADPDSQKRIFTTGRRDKIFAAFRDQFRTEKFDAGLLAGLDEIEAALKAGVK